MEMIFSLAAIAILLGLNFKATVVVIRDSLSEPPQKVAQTLLVWLIPVVGAIVVLAVNRPLEKPSGQYREPTEEPDDCGALRKVARDVAEAIDGD